MIACSAPTYTWNGKVVSQYITWLAYSAESHYTMEAVQCIQSMFIKMHKVVRPWRIPVWLSLFSFLCLFWKYSRISNAFAGWEHCHVQPVMSDSAYVWGTDYAWTLCFVTLSSNFIGLHVLVATQGLSTEMVQCCLCNRAGQCRCCAGVNAGQPCTNCLPGRLKVCSNIP